MTVARITRHATRNVAAAAIEAAGNAVKYGPSSNLTQLCDALDRTTTFYDDAGSPTRSVQPVDAHGILCNPLTGKSVADSGDFKVTFDLVTDERVFDGKVNTARPSASALSTTRPPVSPSSRTGASPRPARTTTPAAPKAPSASTSRAPSRGNQKK